MRRRPGRKIFEIMSPNDDPRACRNHPHAGHARITIGVDEVNPSAHKNILMIRAAGRQNQRSQQCDLGDDPSPVRAAAEQIGIWQLEIGDSTGPTRIRTWDQGIMSPLL